MSGEFRFPNGDIDFFRDGPGAATTLGGGSGDGTPVVSVAGRTGAVVLTKADVGLENVADTAPASLPISTATENALNGKVGSATIKTITTITQAAYDALGTKDPNTMYVVTG